MKVHTYIRVNDDGETFAAKRMKAKEASAAGYDSTREAAIDRALRERRIRAWSY